MEENKKQVTEDNKNGGKDKKHRWWLKILKIFGVTILSILVLVIIACSMIVWILTPERLTPLVEKHASEYLNAEVKVSRVELTFWHTFPKMTLDVDSLNIISHALENLPDSITDLPADADSLLSIDRFHGGINVAAMSIGSISLYDVNVHSVKMNLLKVNDAFANYNILPDDNQDDSTDITPSIPPISINSFIIQNAGPLKFRSLADSLSVEIDLKNITLGGKSAPDYTLSIEANGRSPMLGNLNLAELPVKIDGNISWSDKEPHALTLDRFKVSIDSINTEISTHIDFRDSLTVERLDLRLDQCPAAYLISRLPALESPQLKGLDTDLKFTIDAHLTKPYHPADTSVMPSFEADIEIPDCHILLNRIQFHRFCVAASVNFDGVNLDKSILDIKRFIINGNILTLDFKGTISRPISDPKIDAHLISSIDFNRVPQYVYKQFASVLKGKMTADITIDTQMSKLSANRFHQMKLMGDVDFDQFRFVSADSVNRVYADNSCLQFGTNNRFINSANVTVDSLLTASVKIDSVSVESGPLTIAVNSLKAGIGTRIGKQSPDSTVITPIGGLISTGRIRVTDSSDSSIVRLTDVKCIASLTRFNGDRHAPLLALNFDAGRIMATDRRSFVALSKGHFDVKANLRKRTHQRSSTDGNRLSRQRTTTSQAADNDAMLDLEVDSGLKATLQRWEVTGSIKAERGGFFTPSIALRNRLKNIDIEFSTDSVALRDLHYLTGNSDFLINGTVSNIRRALTRRRNNTLKIDFDVESDTIDINELSRAMMSAPPASSENAILSGESDEIPEGVVINSLPDTASTRAVVIPSNIKADLRLKSRNVIYTDLILHNFNGEILINNSIVNLRNLSASTDIGSVAMSALYSAPAKNDIQFGLGMKVERFNIDKMNTLVPSIDSLIPMLKEFSGVINANIAATSRIDSTMNFEIPSLQAAIKLSGDSLVLLDAETFRSLSKWLVFKNRERNMIDSMSVELLIRDSQIELFPMFFDIDRYRLGVMGRNDMDMNLNYHISVLKSPIPFKFGINIKGNIDKMKIRLGGAKLKDVNVARRVSIADTTRINLINQLENIFRRSAEGAGTIKLQRPTVTNELMEQPDVISAADSAMMIKEGLIDAPATVDSTSTIIK